MNPASHTIDKEIRNYYFKYIKYPKKKIKMK